MKGFLVFIGIATIAFFVTNSLLPKTNIATKKSDFLTSKMQKITYVAIGDSLTEGVGDSTEQGGFVPLLAQDVSSTYNLEVTSKNFGVSGNTSQQILDRIETKSEIAQELKKAKFVTLTVGGNDIMAVIRRDITKIDQTAFKKANQTYVSNLSKIIDAIHQVNSNAPVYILGVYNPFYLNFPEITQIQDVIDDWNKSTENLASDYKNVYFVAINDLLYKGIDGKEGVVQVSGEQVNIVNDALFSEDHFHPNNTGYQIMSNAVMEKINETKPSW